MRDDEEADHSAREQFAIAQTDYMRIKRSLERLRAGEVSVAVSAMLEVSPGQRDSRIGVSRFLDQAATEAYPQLAARALEIAREQIRDIGAKAVHEAKCELIKASADVEAVIGKLEEA